MFNYFSQVDEGASSSSFPARTGRSSGSNWHHLLPPCLYTHTTVYIGGAQTINYYINCYWLLNHNTPRTRNENNSRVGRHDRPSHCETSSLLRNSVQRFFKYKNGKKKKKKKKKRCGLWGDKWLGDDDKCIRVEEEANPSSRVCYSFLFSSQLGEMRRAVQEHMQIKSGLLSSSSYCSGAASFLLTPQGLFILLLLTCWIHYTSSSKRTTRGEGGGAEERRNKKI